MARAVYEYKEELARGEPGASHRAFPRLLRAASALPSANPASQLHAHAIKLGLLFHPFIANALISTYARLSLLPLAQRAFDDMPRPDTVSFNALISAHAALGRADRALRLFARTPSPSVVSWSAALSALARAGRPGDALTFFRRMLLSPGAARPNAATAVALLSACAGDRAAVRWAAAVVDLNAPPPGPVLTTALVHAFSRCGLAREARRRLDRLARPPTAAWNALLGGLVGRGEPESTVELFSLVPYPDDRSWVLLFSALSCMGAIELGKRAHVKLSRIAPISSVFLNTAIVGMYSKGGEISLACLVFVKAGWRDVGLWNAMVGGLAAHGRAQEALALFREMGLARVSPNEVSFVGVLSACSHGGLVQLGRELFEEMRRVHGLEPCLEHYTCMVDLLGRAGHVEEALSLVKGMEVEPDCVIWGSILNSCMIHGFVNLAERISGEVLEKGEEASLGCSMLLANVFASKGQWEGVVRVRRMLKERGARKVSGCSWVEVGGAIHRFLVEDTSHEACAEIYDMLQALMNVVDMEIWEQISL
ncbi:pentatricopeptide repeat-containing protein At1g08070, chloroplastic-like [Wolffia australiana]